MKTGFINIFKLIPALLLVTLFIACVKEEFDSSKLSQTFEIDPSVAVPVGYRTTTIKEIFKPQFDQGKILEDKDGLMYFKYKSNPYTINASDLVKIPDITKNFTITNNTGLALDLANLPKTVVISDSIVIDFGYSAGAAGEKIDSIIINYLQFDFNNNIPYNIFGYIDISFPEIQSNNRIYSKRITINSINQFTDFTGYKITMRTINGNPNCFVIRYSLTLNGGTGIIPAGATIATVNLGFSQIDYLVIYGYFGQIQKTSSVSNINFDFQNENIAGYFAFTHPKLNIYSENSFGIPFGIFIQTFSIITRNLQTQNITVSGQLSPSQPAIIDFPKTNQVGQTVTGTSFINLAALNVFSSKDYTQQANLAVTAQTNPEGPKNYNFIHKNSKLTITGEFELPIWGYTDYLVLQDSMNFDLSSLFTTDLPRINRLLFILNYTNGFPVEVKPQIIFADEFNIVIDSLITTPPVVIPGAKEFDQIGKAIPLKIAPIYVEVSGNKLERIKKAKRMFLKGYLRTVDATLNPPVSQKFFSSYMFYTHIGVAADLTIKQ